ncbi:hypothetical protein V1517DRAFT_26377 [Lipomyces orientalis]|uniref:Uncharacterized protein n=1 Tax=Lipomyces orientalis TaxID=1233043 RepID=A0ACC3TFC3_9ASCO
MGDATAAPISQLPDPQQPNTTSSTQIPPQSGQAVKRGRGRPRKYPLPPDYVSPVHTPKPPRESPAQRTPVPDESEEAVTTSSGRPARSSRRNVDYAKLESTEIPSEGEDAVGTNTNETPTSGQQPKRRRGRPPKDPSKGPMPRPKPKSSVVYIEDEGDDEAVEDVDDENDEYLGGDEQPDDDDDLDADDVVEEEDDEPESDFEEEDETSKRKKSRRSQKSERGKAAEKKSKMAPGTSSTARGSKTRKTKDSVEGRMALFYGNRNAPLMEGIEYRNKWINELTAIRQELLEDPVFPPPDDHEIDLSLQNLVTAEEEKVPLFLPPREQELTFEVGMNEPFKEYSIKANESASLHDLTEGRREGFVIHTGGYVTGCQWAPLMDSNVQYLVVSIVSKVDEFAASMFDRATYDSVIQVWKMDPDRPNSSRARLALCLLHSWGTPWSLRFCPEARSKNDSTVGCFAAAFQDGKVRVISVPAVDSQNTEYLMVERPAKEISLPGMSITCVTWTTPHVLAVGCTNGFVATFDLAIADEPDDDDDDQARPLNVHMAPIICTPVHQSAILTLESGCPDYPHILITSSADGYTRTLDTRDPRSCRASAYRTKGYSAATTYVPSLNAVISVEDSILTKITPILNLLTDLIFTRHEASVMCIASGKCHPFTATGGADGAVTVANPVARALVGKKITYKDWPQTRLFKLEYSERQGKFRFVEGYKVDVVGFAGSGGKGGYLIYPETVCVTSLGWNWRRQTGGWIAAGFANGLVRIENFSM